MNTLGYITAILVLAFIISVGIGYLLLYRRKIGRDSRNDGSEILEGKSIDRVEKAELQTIQEGNVHEAIEAITQGIEEVSLSKDNEILLASPTACQRDCYAPQNEKWRGSQSYRYVHTGPDFYGFRFGTVLPIGQPRHHPPCFGRGASVRLGRMSRDRTFCPLVEEINALMHTLNALIWHG
jgi:hypothetical protein